MVKIPWKDGQGQSDNTKRLRVTTPIQLTVTRRSYTYARRRSEFGSNFVR